ncbi:MAG TPA: efflux RND transporter periplasmic adaptor subunit, partial [Edaphobacter sp.]
QQGDLLKGTSKIPLTLKLANGDNYAHKGKIAFVDRQMNAQTGAIRIAASFPNPGNVLRPGQFGRVRAETQVRHGAILVPQSAILELQGIQQAFTIDASNKVHIVNVKLGPQYGDSWIIEEGLSSGTQVITDNLQKLKEGVVVAPHEVSYAPTPAPSKQTAGR